MHSSKVNTYLTTKVGLNDCGDILCSKTHAVQCICMEYNLVSLMPMHLYHSNYVKLQSFRAFYLMFLCFTD